MKATRQSGGSLGRRRAKGHHGVAGHDSNGHGSAGSGGGGVAHNGAAGSHLGPQSFLDYISTCLENDLASFGEIGVWSGVAVLEPKGLADLLCSHAPRVLQARAGSAPQHVRTLSVPAAVGLTLESALFVIVSLLLERVSGGWAGMLAWFCDGIRMRLRSALRQCMPGWESTTKPFKVADQCLPTGCHACPPVLPAVFGWGGNFAVVLACGLAYACNVALVALLRHRCRGGGQRRRLRSRWWPVRRQSAVASCCCWVEAASALLGSGS